MTDPEGKSSGKSLWIVILILLLVLVIGWFSNPLGKVEEAPPAQPAAPSTDWAEEPETPGVDVNLPETPMTNAPPAPASEPAPAQPPAG